MCPRKTTMGPTDEQWFSVMDAVLSDQMLLTGTFSGPSGAMRMQEKWQKVARDANELGPVQKTGEEWRVSLNKLKSRAKARLKDMQAYTGPRRSGGGPDASHMGLGLNHVYEKAITLIKKASLYGNAKVKTPLEARARVSGRADEPYSLTRDDYDEDDDFRGYSPRRPSPPPKRSPPKRSPPKRSERLEDFRRYSPPRRLSTPPKRSPPKRSPPKRSERLEDFQRYSPRRSSPNPKRWDRFDDYKDYKPEKFQDEFYARKLARDVDESIRNATTRKESTKIQSPRAVHLPEVVNLSPSPPRKPRLEKSPLKATTPSRWTVSESPARSPLLGLKRSLESTATRDSAKKHLRFETSREFSTSETPQALPDLVNALRSVVEPMRSMKTALEENTAAVNKLTEEVTMQLVAMT